MFLIIVKVKIDNYGYKLDGRGGAGKEKLVVGETKRRPKRKQRLNKNAFGNNFERNKIHF